MQKTVIDALVAKNEVTSKLKLTSSVSTSNMHVFDENCKIRKMSCPEEIIFRFYTIRKEYFIKRKKYIIEKLDSENNLLKSKILFIRSVINKKIDLFNKKKDFIVKQISEIPEIIKINDCYDYLLEMKIYTLTAEKINNIEEKIRNLNMDLEKIKGTTISEMWNSELNEL
jgi:DNA topoisomerase-2